MEDIWKQLPNDVFIKHIAPLCSIDIRIDLGILPSKMKTTTIHNMLSYMLAERANARKEEDIVHRFSTRLYHRGQIGHLRYSSIGYHINIYYSNVLKYSIEKWYEVEVNNQTFAAISSFDLYDCSGKHLFTKDNGLERLPKVSSVRELYKLFFLM